MRPQSIVMFERCYLGGWVIGVINTALNWTATANDPQVMQASVTVGAWYMPTVVAIGLIIPLILWYCVARRGSVIAKWIVVVLVAIGVAGLIYSVAAGRMPAGAAAMLSVVGVALNLYAASRLFQPDARPWFGEAPVEAA